MSFSLSTGKSETCSERRRGVLSTALSFSTFAHFRISDFFDLALHLDV